MTQIGKSAVFFLMLILLISTIVPAYAAVTSFHTDRTFYVKGDQVSISGTVDVESTGLVSIVFRDSNNKFVLLTQAFIQSDSTFKKYISTELKFTDHGIHNATAFIFNLTKGKTVSFDFSMDGSIPIPSITKILTSESPVETGDSVSNENESRPKVIPETFSENEESELLDFVDPEKEPQHYLDRYYNESTYQDWFDRNYPDLTIEEAVGLESQTNLNIKEAVEEKIDSVISVNILPDVEAATIINEPLSNVNSNNHEFTLLSLALGGVAVLFGATYGIKRKVDTDSKNISQNRASVRKMFGFILGYSPMDVIKNRLARGEISINQYTRLKKILGE
ncbi:MAG: SHOCT domain-containing protein [Thaumarchaeota archaeon]|nr:SHOCT domain-containing protein [Nitrososphaerota archaeon]